MQITIAETLKIRASALNFMADNGGATDMEIDPPPTPYSTFPWLNCGGCYLPKPNLSKPRGEDAHFFFADRKAIGVADGVGGWTKRGVDSGEYARELMAQCAAAIDRQPEDALNLRNALIEAFHNTSNLLGSSTACLITVRNDFFLHAVNIGDSGLMIFRDNSIFYQSPTQQYRFNCPFQLGGNGPSDNPDSAMELQVPVKANDVIVVATDGLFDNVFPSEIEDLLRSFSAIDSCPMIEPGMLAFSISNLARRNSIDRRRETPYSKAARRVGLHCDGGKIDDITVVVGYVHAV